MKNQTSNRYYAKAKNLSSNPKNPFVYYWFATKEARDSYVDRFKEIGGVWAVKRNEIPSRYFSGDMCYRIHSGKNL